MGGDEFVVILLDVSREEFARKTEQLRRQMQENSVDASIGEVWQASTENLEDLLRRADENMYRGKEALLQPGRCRPETGKLTGLHGQRTKKSDKGVLFHSCFAIVE